jgi:2-polyprenyl-3-methyl-5-hydroxy-6-metoxy-1,4-benzoquinol methylase
MKNSSDIARHISSLFENRSDQYYTRTKLSTDPLYEGVLTELEASPRPLLDIGCGLGLLALYLREQGKNNPITGLDYDARKIKVGQQLLNRGNYKNITLSQGDARLDLPNHQGDVTILDILQFFEADEQKKLLQIAAKKLTPGSKLIIRSGLKEKNARFFITWLGDLIAKCTFWMKAAPTHYPTEELFQTTLEAEGCTVTVRPFWGKTPFNNYLIVATRN